MKPETKFNTENHTKVTGKMSTEGADRFALLLGISTVALSFLGGTALVIFAIGYAVS